MLTAALFTRMSRRPNSFTVASTIFATAAGSLAVPDMRIRHIYRRDRMLRAGDQTSYLIQGYAAERFTEPHENFAHENQNVQVVSGVQFGDLVDFLDSDYLARVAKVCATTMWSLAQGPAAPKNVRQNATTVTNDTILDWDANTETDLKGYEVVWRETTDPDWTHVIPVGNVTTVTLPDFSRDNAFFGVRAVDQSGHHSPVEFPTPF